MSYFAPPVELCGTDSHSVTVAPPAAGNSPPEARIAVGHVRLIEDELDDVIQDLATQSALAEDRGDIETAIELSIRMVVAIKSRTPEHRARIDAAHLAAAQRGLDEGVDFFQAEGRRAAQEIGRP